jgi:hypothetical protein
MQELLSKIKGYHDGCWSENGRLHRALIKYADVSTARIFTVYELVQMDAEVIHRDQIQTHLGY